MNKKILIKWIPSQKASKYYVKIYKDNKICLNTKITNNGFFDFSGEINNVYILKITCNSNTSIYPFIILNNSINQYVFYEKCGYHFNRLKRIYVYDRNFSNL